MTTMTRTQIQFDCSPELRQQLRVIAMQQGMSLRELIIRTMADKYPETKVLAEKEFSQD